MVSVQQLPFSNNTPLTTHLTLSLAATTREVSADLLLSQLLPHSSTMHLALVPAEEHLPLRSLFFCPPTPWWVPPDCRLSTLVFTPLMKMLSTTDKSLQNQPWCKFPFQQWVTRLLSVVCTVCGTPEIKMNLTGSTKWNSPSLFPLPLKQINKSSQKHIRKPSAKRKKKTKFNI